MGLIVGGGAHVVDAGWHADTIDLTVEQLVRLCVIDGRQNHDLLAGHPVGRCGNLRNSIGQLHRVNHTQNFAIHQTEETHMSYCIE